MKYTFPINEDALIERFQDALYQNGGSFMSYKIASFCGDQIYDVITQLKILARQYPERAKAAAEKMIDDLLHTDTDDDQFPIPELMDLYEIAGEEKTYDGVGKIYCSYR